MNVLVVHCHSECFTMADALASALRRHGDVVSVLALPDGRTRDSAALRRLPAGELVLRARNKCVYLWRRRKYASARSNAFREAVRSCSPDVIWTLVADELTCEDLAFARACQCLLIHWNADAYPLRYRTLMETAPLYDWFYTFDKAYISQVRLLAPGTRVEHLPLAPDLGVFSPVVHREPEIPVSFAGASYINYESAGILRASLLDAVGREFPLQVFGDDGWETHSRRYSGLRGAYQHRSLAPSEMNGLINRSLVSLNIHYTQTGLNLRTFEICAAGGCQVVDDVSDLHALFEPNSELLTYRHRDEMIDHLKQCTARPERCKDLCVRARARILREHTYDHRVAQVMSDIQ